VTVVRALGPNWAEPLARAEALAFDRPWGPGAYAEELARPFARALGAFDGTRLAGAVCLWVLTPDAEILRIFTVPAARRRGIGRTLLAAARAEARRAGCRRVLLEVGAQNAPALACYRAAGFVQVGLRRGYYAGGADDAVQMALDLVGAAGEGGPRRGPPGVL